MTATPSRRSSVKEDDLKLVLRDHPEGLELAVYVQPRASRTRWAGLHGDRIKVALASPPVDGKANRALVAFIASSLGVSRSRVRLLAGASSRRKRVLLEGVTTASVLSRLMP